LLLLYLRADCEFVHLSLSYCCLKIFKVFNIPRFFLAYFSFVDFCVDSTFVERSMNYVIRDVDLGRLLRLRTNFSSYVCSFTLWQILDRARVAKPSRDLLTRSASLFHSLFILFNFTVETDKASRPMRCEK